MKPVTILLCLALFVFQISKAQSIFKKAYLDTNSQALNSVVDIVEAVDGSFFVTGDYYYTNNNRDLILSRLDKSGNTMWSKTYGGPYFDHSASLIVKPDKSCMILGMYYLNNASYTEQEIILIKTDSLGNILWQKRYGGPGADDAGRAMPGAAAAGRCEARPATPAHGESPD